MDSLQNLALRTGVDSKYVPTEKEEIIEHITGVTMDEDQEEQDNQDPNIKELDPADYTLQELKNLCETKGLKIAGTK